MLSLIPRFSPWPVERVSLDNMLYIKNTQPSAASIGTIGGGTAPISFISECHYDLATGRILMPYATTDNVRANYSYDLAFQNDTVVAASSHGFLGGSTAYKVGAFGAVSRNKNPNGQRLAVLTRVSPPTDVAWGNYIIDGNALNQIRTAPVFILNATAHMNLNAQCEISADGLVALMQYTDGTDGRYGRCYRMTWDPVLGRYDRAASEGFIGQTYPGRPLHVSGTQFLISGIATTGHIYAQLVDLAEDTFVAVAAFPSLNTVTAGHRKFDVQQMLNGDFLLSYIDSAGNFNAELFRITDATSVRLDSYSHPESNLTIASSERLGNVVVLACASTVSIDLIKVQVDATTGQIGRVGVDVGAFPIETNFTRTYRTVKLSDSKLLLFKAATTNSTPPRYQVIEFEAGPLVPVLSIKDGLLPEGVQNIGCTLTAQGVSVPVGGHLSVPADPKYAPNQSDFTIDAVLTVRSTVQGTGAGSANALTTLIFWGTWGAVGQPLNFELIYNHTTGALGLNTSWTDATQNVGVNYTLPIGQKVNIRCVRKRSVLYIYADNQLLRQVAHPVNIGYDTPQPLLIGRRKGGGSGEVSWYCDMLLESLTITKEALMP